VAAYVRFVAGIAASGVGKQHAFIGSSLLAVWVGETAFLCCCYVKRRMVLRCRAHNVTPGTIVVPGESMRARTNSLRGTPLRNSF
jgi:hypothetical protein